MKKRISILLTLCLLLSYCLALTLCDFIAHYIHECQFTEQWTWDEDSHWHTCSFKYCNEISDKGLHDWDDGVITTKPTQDADDFRLRRCGY